MLKRVTATRFDRRMTSGKTWPCLLGCHDDAGLEVEVVAKFSGGCERGPGGLVAEAVGAMLGADLGLPVPKPWVVEFDAGFVDLVALVDTEVADRMRRSGSRAFGSTKLPAGFSTIPLGKPFPAELRAAAAEIFAFDAIIQNPDRRPQNPNLLFDGRQLAVFDHELAFVRDGILGWEPPWKRGGIDAIASRTAHVLFADLKGKRLDLDRFRGAMKGIANARFDRYRAELPDEWTDASELADRTIDFLKDVRANVDATIDEIVRVLQ